MRNNIYIKIGATVNEIQRKSDIALTQLVETSSKLYYLTFKNVNIKVEDVNFNIMQLNEQINFFDDLLGQRLER